MNDRVERATGTPQGGPPSPLGGRRVLLGVCGGISAFKAVEVLRRLTAAGADVQVVMTEAAQRFVGPMTFRELSYRPVASDLFAESIAGAPMQHLEFAEQADLVLIAPATADLMAKMAVGIADTLLLVTLLATRAPILLAPAMDADMFTHPATQANLQRLRDWGVHMIGPVEGELARRNVGPGRLAEPADIVAEAIRLVESAGRAPSGGWAEASAGARERIASWQAGAVAAQAAGEAEGADDAEGASLAGLRLVVTAGPTHEPIDPVRYIGNRSSGKMGYAIAAVAAERGAQVLLVSGPTKLPTPPGVKRIDVTTALEMREAVVEAFERADVVIKAAAVGDYRVESAAPEKIKRSTEGDALTVRLVPNPDILAELGRMKRPGQLLVGFAAETGHPIDEARRKLAAKNCDLLVANDVTEAGAGFDVDTNRVHIVARSGEVESLPLMTKEAVAGALLERIAALRSSAGRRGGGGR